MSNLQNLEVSNFYDFVYLIIYLFIFLHAHLFIHLFIYYVCFLFPQRTLAAASLMMAMRRFSSTIAMTKRNTTSRMTLHRQRRRLSGRGPDGCVLLASCDAAAAPAAAAQNRHSTGRLQR